MSNIICKKDGCFELVDEGQSYCPKHQKELELLVGKNKNDNNIELVICPACKKEISSKAKSCINCGHPMQDREENISKNKIKCPNCDSLYVKKITKASKAGSAILFGVFSFGKITKTYECKSCDYRW